MKKEDILKLHGLSEAEFYKRFPTEESYAQFCMGGYMQQGGTGFVPPTNATKVIQPDQGYNMIPGQDPAASKLYFDKQIEDAKRSSSGTMSPDQKAQYQDFLIKQAQSGVHPDEIIKKGYATAAMKDTLMQAYKPVYTEKTPPAVKPNMPLNTEDIINRKEIFPTGNQAYRTFNYPDVNAGYTKPTTRYFDPSGNKEIDVTKSFDDKGNFKPFYIESTPGVEGTLKQTRGIVADPNNLQQSTNAITNTQSTGFQFGGDIPNFFNPEFFMKMGGKPCYDCGGAMYQGGGLSRGDDYGSKKKPYPSVEASDFAGGDRSYPIPTRADAIDALRLAGLHGREDVKAKVYAKYPDLKKQMGGMHDMHQMPNGSWMMNKDMKEPTSGPEYPGQTQESLITSKKNDFLQFIRDNTMNAIKREESAAWQNFMQMGGVNMQDYRTDAFQNKFNPYVRNPNMMNQNLYQNAANMGMNNFQNDMGNFFGATQNMMSAQYGAQTFDWNYQGTQQPQFTTPESVGMQNNNTMMQGQTDQPYPITSGQPGQKKKPVSNPYTTRSMEPEANWAIAGMNAVSSAFELAQAKKNEEKFKQLQGADNQFYSTPAGNRGDYDQFGNFRPNQKVPVQFAGQNYGEMGTPYTFQEGGEYYMSDEQIESIMKAGGQIEFLD